MATTPAPDLSNLGDVLVVSDEAVRERWADEFRRRGLRLQLHPGGVSDAAAVRFAAVWNPPPGALDGFPNLRAVTAMGAGVDGVVAAAPAGVPLLRVVDPLMAQRMATWVVWAVVNAQRRCDAYAAAQAARRWGKDVEDYRSVDNAELRVGMMGLGVMGGAAAAALAALGYDLRAWTRTPRGPGAAPAGAALFHGAGQLAAFASGCDVLVCLLPLTAETRGVLSAPLFEALPRGATVVNAARGGHLVEADLLAALDAGRLGGAVLDVTDPEPLPAASRLWGHPRVRLFPHVASMTNIETGADQMVATWAALAAGGAPPPELVVDLGRGY